MTVKERFGIVNKLPDAAQTTPKNKKPCLCVRNRQKRGRQVTLVTTPNRSEFCSLSTRPTRNCKKEETKKKKALDKNGKVW